MIKEKVSTKQMIFTIVLFIMGSSLIVGVGTSLEQDTWISLLISSVVMIPIFIMFARILKLFPGKNLYDIFEELFGNKISKMLIILFSWYALHLASLVVRDFSDFFKVAMLPETPEFAIMIIILIVCTYLVKSGIEVLGRWSLVTLPILILLVLTTFLAAFPAIDLTNMLPIMNHSLKDVINDSFIIITFPLAEAVLFLTIGNIIEKKDSTYKIFLGSLLISTIILLVVVVRNVAILGAGMKGMSYFPSYEAVRILSIGSFLTRIEGAIVVNFLFAGILKISICLAAAAKGISKLINISDYKKLVIPISLTVLSLASVLYNNIYELLDFLDIYKFYALPFQIIIPFVVWIWAEVRIRKIKKRENFI